MGEDHSRREFIATAGLLAAGRLVRPAPEPERRAARAPDGTVIVFQGDSITDCGRNRSAQEPNLPAALGAGYPFLVSAAALADRPQAGLRFYNRGVSGDKVADLAARWNADALDLKPDILSILIGVNDFWHRLLRGYAGTVRDYEDGYTALLETTRRALPKVRLIVLEPFVLRTGVVDDRWFPELDERRAAASRVARRAGARFVPLQSLFDDLSRRASPAYWAGDGVHPTAAGHAVIAERWRKAAGV
jgi:lysophospholipase L1-like esterase